MCVEYDMNRGLNVNPADPAVTKMPQEIFQHNSF